MFAVLLSGIGKNVFGCENLNRGSSHPHRRDLFFKNDYVGSEMLIERCSYKREKSLFYTVRGGVLSIMVWNYVGNEPSRYTLI